MIERQNWLDVCAYLDYAHRVLQVDDKTAKRKRTQLRHLLEWADGVTFSKARGIDPTFPAYLRGARNDGKGRPLAPATMARACEEARSFFLWARGEYPARYKLLSESWIRTIKPDRAHGRQTEVEGRVLWELAEVVKIAKLEPKNLTEKRDIAATCFLFLSGMRIDAFITLPLDCVDLVKGQVKQIPAKGVRTKNHKAAITYLLDGDDLQELKRVVMAWDQHIRPLVDAGAPWYTFLGRDGELSQDIRTPGIDRASLYRKGLHRLCKRAGLEYKSPHKLRHGHAVYSLKKCKDVSQLKAVSQNMMHGNLSITDGLYSVLTSGDVGANIRNLGRGSSDLPGSGAQNQDDLIRALYQMLQEKGN